jgi:hypothetical protein
MTDLLTGDTPEIFETNPSPSMKKQRQALE